MAKHIGLSKDYVFKETSARIIPDIGVLQQFPRAPIGSIEQSFVNSMSANERLATLENWRRLSLYELNDCPKTQVIALINNRNDRVARSKVFANILSNDLRFDRIVVIGSNVDGFYSYFINALTERIDKLIENNDIEELESLLIQLNLLTAEQLHARFVHAYGQTNADKLMSLSEGTLNKACVKEILGDILDSQVGVILSYFRHHFQRNALAALQENIAENANEIKERLLTITKSKITVHENSNLSADELTISTADLALPNTHQVIVGMQNIKGAGLNYVYAWQQWQKIHQTIRHLFTEQCSAKEFRTALTNLNMIVSFNLIEIDYMKQHLATLKKTHLAQNEFCQAEISSLLEKLEEDESNQKQEQQQSLLVKYFNQLIESFLDAGAAVKRKKRANQIYRDIADQRITLEKAIKLLGKLSRNQKSGWFANKSNQD